jgi:hypothetical protein
MKLLFYANETDAPVERLRYAIEGVAVSHRVETCETVVSLLQQLRLGVYDLIAIVLYVSNKKELMEVLALDDWLRDVPIILVLPDRNGATLAQGLTLRPRYISYSDADFTDVSAVLTKMLATYHKNRGRICPSEMR